MSADNLISERRRQLGLSQRALADVVGTSQQQIQRIESGVQTARLDLAIKIANALKSSLGEIFPRLPKTRQSKATTRTKRPKREEEPEFVDGQYLKAGIDTDPRHWTIKMGFHDGREFLYAVSATEKERISSIVWNASFDFLVFDTKNTRVAVRRDNITFCNFLFDLNLIEQEEKDEVQAVVVHFVESQTPVRFEVEPDDIEAEDDEDGFRSQLQNLFFYIEATSADEDEVLWFDDMDNERVYVRTKQLLSLEVPLLCCEPRLWRSHLENLDGDASGAEANSQVQSTQRKE